MREDGTPDLDADGTPTFRELDNADYEVLGKDKQIGAQRTDGVVVSNSFEIQ